MHLVISGFGAFEGYEPILDGGLTTGLGISF
jgi:hypothetical protein